MRHDKVNSTPLVEHRRDRCTPVVCRSFELPRDPNQSSTSPVIDYKRLVPGESKERTLRFKAGKELRKYVTFMDHWNLSITAAFNIN